MNGFAQKIVGDSTGSGAFARDARASFIGSKIMQSIGVEGNRLDRVHHLMLLRLIEDNASVPTDEADHLAARIVAAARFADRAAAAGGSKAAMAAVMRESGSTIDPMIAQSFIRLASSSVFWMALNSAGEARAG